MPDLFSTSIRPRHHLAIGTLLALAHMLYYLGWSMDDPFITFIYLDHWVTGHGLVFNIGDPPIEGYSNFLWLLLLIPFRLAFGPDALFASSQFLGMLCALATGPLLALTWQRTGPPAKDAAPLWRWLPMYLWSLSGPAMFWAVGGLETPLVALLITIALFMVQHEWQIRSSKTLLVSLLFVLLAMARPEGAMYGVAFYAATALRLKRVGQEQRRAWGISVAVFLGGLIVYELWRWFTFHALLPNTYGAKIGGDLLGRLREGNRYVAEVTVNTAGLPIVAWLGLWTWKRGAAIRLAAVFAGLQLLFIVCVGGDWMPGARLLVHALPCFLLLGTAGLRRSWDGLTSVTRKRALRDLLILLLLIWVCSAAIAERFATREVVRLLRAGQLQEPLYEASAWILQNTPPDATVAGEEAGIIPYYTMRRFLDLLGLNDARLAALPGVMNDQMDAGYVVNEWAPDVVLLLSTPDAANQQVQWHTGAGGRLANSAEFQGNYREVHQIPRQWGTVVTRVFQRVQAEAATPEAS